MAESKKPPRSRQATDRELELGAELQAAQRTIDVLLDQAEKTNRELRELTANLDQAVRHRTRALAESEAQLRAKNAELERQTAARGEFIAIVAHELRTPMTAIVGYLDLLAEDRFGEIVESAKRPLAALRRNAQRLKRLADEMLDVTRIEAGKIVIRRSAVDLGAEVRDVVAELGPLANSKAQTVTVETATIGTIDADVDKIHQIAINLVSNAIRYTPPGGKISVIVDKAPGDRYPGDWARLRVRDTGVGIAATNRQRIFEPFSDVQPVKHHTSTGPDSAGLGLYIARGLVEHHGGLLTVESEEGVYTEFTVLLPFKQSPAGG